MDRPGATKLQPKLTTKNTRNTKTAEDGEELEVIEVSFGVEDVGDLFSFGGELAEEFFL